MHLPMASPMCLLLLELLLAKAIVIPFRMLLRVWYQCKVYAGGWQGYSEGSPQDGSRLAGPGSAWYAAAAQAQPAGRPESMQALPISGFADRIFRHSRVSGVGSQCAECCHRP